MNKPLITNVADEKQVKDAKVKELIGYKRDNADLLSVIGTPHGRRLVFKWLGYCGLYDVGFDTNNSVQSKNAGMRNVGIKILADIERADSLAYPKMMIEMHNELTKENNNHE